MADLHPIVIGPIDYTFKSIKYTCTGEGLYKDGYLYDSHPEKYFPPRKVTSESKEVEKRPVAYWKAQCAFRGLNQTGAINDLQVRIREAKKPMLPELKQAEKDLNKEFKKQNKLARDGSWKSLKTVEQKAKADPKKFLAEAFPKGATGRPANLDIVVVKIGTDEQFALSQMAEKMSLEAVSVDAPWISNKKPNPDRWLVIGRTRDAVWNQMKEIERDTARSKQNMPKEKTKEPPKQKTPKLSKELKESKTTKPPQKQTPQAAMRSASSDRTPAPYSHIYSQESNVNNTLGRFPAPDSGSFASAARKTAIPIHSSMSGYSGSTVDFDKEPSTKRRTKQTARKTAFPDHSSFSGYGGPAVVFDDEPSMASKQGTAKSDNSWDIRGSYKIKCPAIEEEWGPQGDPSLTLDLYFETRGGKPQLYGMFHFRIIEGIMRFEKPVPVPKSEKVDSFKKRKWEDDEDRGMYDYPVYDGSSKAYDDKVFFLGATDKVTARRPTWKYRWRGTETGEGEIQLGSCKGVNSMTFSNKGAEVSGTFKCDYARECHFTGVKVRSRPGDGYVDPEAQWANHSEAAYEHARTSRWG